MASQGAYSIPQGAIVFNFSHCTINIGKDTDDRIVSLILEVIQRGRNGSTPNQEAHDNQASGFKASGLDSDCSGSEQPEQNTKFGDVSNNSTAKGAHESVKAPTESINDAPSTPPSTVQADASRDANQDAVDHVKDDETDNLHDEHTDHQQDVVELNDAHEYTEVETNHNDAARKVAPCPEINEPVAATDTDSPSEQSLTRYKAPLLVWSQYNQPTMTDWSLIMAWVTRDPYQEVKRKQVDAWQKMDFSLAATLDRYRRKMRGKTATINMLYTYLQAVGESTLHWCMFGLTWQQTAKVLEEERDNATAQADAQNQVLVAEQERNKGLVREVEIRKELAYLGIRDMHEMIASLEDMLPRSVKSGRVNRVLHDLTDRLNDLTEAFSPNDAYAANEFTYEGGGSPSAGTGQEPEQTFGPQFGCAEEQDPPLKADPGDMIDVYEQSNTAYNNEPIEEVGGQNSVGREPSLGFNFPGHFQSPPANTNDEPGKAKQSEEERGSLLGAFLPPMQHHDTEVPISDEASSSSTAPKAKTNRSEDAQFDAKPSFNFAQTTKAFKFGPSTPSEPAEAPVVQNEAFTFGTPALNQPTQCPDTEKEPFTFGTSPAPGASKAKATFDFGPTTPFKPTSPPATKSEPFTFTATPQHQPMSTSAPSSSPVLQPNNQTAPALPGWSTAPPSERPIAQPKKRSSRQSSAETAQSQRDMAAEGSSSTTSPPSKGSASSPKQDAVVAKAAVEDAEDVAANEANIAPKEGSEEATPARKTPAWLKKELKTGDVAQAKPKRVTGKQANQLTRKAGYKTYRIFNEGESLTAKREASKGGKRGGKGGK